MTWGWKGYLSNASKYLLPVHNNRIIHSHKGHPFDLQIYIKQITMESHKPGFLNDDILVKRSSGKLW
jgi:hypothetical protein